MNVETVKTCPVCHRQALQPYLLCRDTLISQAQFQLQRCNNCGFIMTNPRPVAAELGQYYESDDYVSHDTSQKTLFTRVYETVRSVASQQKLRRIEEAKPVGKTLLDIGCGTGDFLQEAQRQGWNVAGCEPSTKARQSAITKVGNVVTDDLEALPATDMFDVITLWHVLEHVPDLHQYLQTIRSLLKPGGVLAIAVPNNHAWDARKYAEHWAAYDVPRHLSHFNRETLTRLLSYNGFKPVQTYPMWFDAFYIALLSTKHRDGRLKYVEGLWNGLLSNLKATSSGDFSSTMMTFRNPD